MPPPVSGSCGGCPAVWSISDYRSYCSRESTVQSPQPLWLELRGSAAWQAAPSRAVCRHACHQLLPWLPMTFAMVPDAAWPASEQWPWSTAPATGPLGRLGRPSASDPLDCGPLRPVPLPPSLRLRVRCPGSLGACSPVCMPFVFRVWCLWPRGSCSTVRALCVVCVWWW